jgi:aminoglycoside 6-adenylyltransferase
MKRDEVDPTAQAYEHLIAKFIPWAEGREDIRAAVVIGSRARGADHPADEFSDLDIILAATDPQPYIAAGGWVEAIGVPWLAFVEKTPDGRLSERRVLFEGGLDVDFAFMPVDLVREMLKTGVDPDLADMIRRGVRVLVDKDGLAAQMLAAAPIAAQPPQAPSEAEFLQIANDFWYHTVWTAKHLRRGELWWAKGCCDGYLKALLLRMLEWHARATRGPEHDTWMRGRFLEEWADPRAVMELRRAFARYDTDEIWRALAATMDLFRWVSVETADRWGYAYAYPTFGAERATELVHKLLAGKA